jgi:hypothetical protein
MVDSAFLALLFGVLGAEAEVRAASASTDFKSYLRIPPGSSFATRHVGQPVVRRYSGGKDIAAACGTLAGSLTLAHV